MRTGYGRGYYGDGQLEPRRRGGWGKLALVVGVGAVIWLMWPRSPKPEHAPGRAGDEPQPFPPSPPPEPQQWLPSQQLLPAPSQQLLPAPSQQPLPAPSQQTLSQVAESRGYPSQQTLSQVAESRGYPSQQEYEDAVVASARQLQTTGAKVVLAPHLAHLASRLTP
jgi:hypothetical protein